MSAAPPVASPSLLGPSRWRTIPSFLSSKADLFALSKFHVALIARMQGRSRRGIKKVEHGQAQGAGTYGAQGYKHPSAAPNTTVIGPA